MMRWQLARALFIVAYFGVAIYSWSSWSEALPQYKNEALFISSILLYAMTFPASLLVQLTYIALGQLISIDNFDAGTGFMTWMFLTWTPLTLAGYLQWFVLVPRCARYLLNRRDDE